MVHLKRGTEENPCHLNVDLPISKSMANRHLVLRHGMGKILSVTTNSDPDDVRRLEAMLHHKGPVWDAGHGGTTFRFLLALYSLLGKEGTVTGTPRMCERPIGPLVDALRSLGAEIRYLKKDGFPPVFMEGADIPGFGDVVIDGSLSSQFVTSVALCTPLFREGLRIRFDQPVASQSYWTMTIDTIRQYGFQILLNKDSVTFLPGHSIIQEWNPERDWSSAAYLLAHLACSPVGSTVFFPGLKFDSLQGDILMAEWVQRFGVEGQNDETGLHFTKKNDFVSDRIQLDFSSCPDLAQTMIVLCAVKGVEGQFSGLETLRIKETDRLNALRIELGKCGVSFFEDEKSGIWTLTGKATNTKNNIWSTWDDHRMAMSGSLLLWTGSIAIENPRVVTKSFPGFWDALSGLNVSVEF